MTRVLLVIMDGAGYDAALSECGWLEGVSVPEVDALVAGALDAGAEGARLTGGGFGGSIVALVAKDHVADWCKTIAGAFPSARILAIT